jgi:hypothetical protein
MNEIIIQGTMELNMLKGQPTIVKETLEGTYLVEHIVQQLFLAYFHESPSKPEKIRIAGVSTSHYVVILAEVDCLGHHARV